MTEFYEDSVNKIKQEQPWAVVRPAFTADLWRSRTKKEYFGLTVHWVSIEARVDGGPATWRLRWRGLGSARVPDASIDHAGE